MRSLNKLLTKTDSKSIKKVFFKHFIVYSELKCLFFSQETLGEERIPTGRQEEENTLRLHTKF